MKRTSPESREASLSPRKREKTEKTKTDISSSPSDDDLIVGDPINGDFSKFRISKASVDLLKSQGKTCLMPIQLSSFDPIYNGKDVIARDITGSGKTLGFALPLLERLREGKLFKKGKSPLVIAILPTRELAIQVGGVFNSLMQKEDEFRCITMYGGTPYEIQERQLHTGVDIIVGTTGRMIDHLERANFSLKNLRCCILDEADKMLELGFKEDIEKVFEFVKKEKQTLEEGDTIQCLMFSATMPEWVRNVSRKFMTEPMTIDLVKDLKNKTAKSVEHLSINVPYQNRISVLGDIILCYGGAHCKTIVFCETKAEANELFLSEKIKDMEVLHGDIPQKQREVTFKGFKEGRFHVLVATDVASRGLDIPKVDLIIQCEPPKDVETYIHRSGRTGRAGRSGRVITFYTKKQQPLIYKIENKAGIKFEKIGAPQPEHIVKASFRDIERNLNECDSEALDIFEDSAEAIITKFGAKEAVQRCLAYISGNKTEIKTRSLLSGYEGQVTYEMKTHKEFRTIQYVWNILKNIFKDNITSSIKGMRSFENNSGAAFDVPDEMQEEFEKSLQSYQKYNKCSFTINIAKELPELKEDRMDDRRFGNDRRFGGGYGGYGGYGGDRGRGGYGGGRYGGHQMSGGYRQNAPNGRDYYDNRKRDSMWDSNKSGGRYAPRGPRRSPSYGKKRNYSSSRSNSPKKDNFRRGGGGREASGDFQSVFIGGCEDKEALEDFLKDNKIAFDKINFLYDQEGKSKRVAFVDVKNDDVRNVLKLDHMKYMDRFVRINMSNDKPSRPREGRRESRDSRGDRNHR